MFGGHVDIEPIDSGLAELEETIDNLSETLSATPGELPRHSFSSELALPSHLQSANTPCSTDTGSTTRNLNKLPEPDSLETVRRDPSTAHHGDSEALKMLDEMNYFREKKFFCDVTIIVGAKEIEVIIIQLKFYC